jgi:DNA-binding response OmpR family regulator
MKNILSIDDDLSMLEVIQTVLTDKGYRVFATSSAAEASRILQDNEIDLVLLDVNMPEKHGFTLYRELETRQHVPVLFLTACAKSFSADSEEFVQMWQNLFSLGTTEILYKPFDIDVLYEKVESLIGQAEVAGNG